MTILLAVALACLTRYAHTNCIACFFQLAFAMFFSKTKILSFALVVGGILLIQIFNITPVDSLDQRALTQSNKVVVQSINTELVSSGLHIRANEIEQNELSFLLKFTENYESNVPRENFANQARVSIKTKPVKDSSLSGFGRLNQTEKSDLISNAAPTISFYRVEPGDTPSRIATLTGLDVDMLRMVNHIGHGESIFEGQKLLIPSQQDLNISLTEDLHWPFEYEELPFVVSQHFKGRHFGIDFDLPNRSPIRASASGLVTFASWDPVGYGNMILIYHGDEVFTLYAHLDSNKVEAGDTVSQGAVIGYAGNTGFSSNTHLHFEVLHRFESLNPCLHIKVGCNPEK